LHFSNIYIKKTYIQWNNGLIISSEEILLVTSKKKKKSTFNQEDINKYIKLLSKTKSVIKEISVKKISTPTLNAVFFYSDKKNSSLNLKYKNYDLQSNIFILKDMLLIHINNLHDQNNTVKLSGDIILNAVNNTQYIKLNAIINNDANITAFAVADSKKLRYGVKSHSSIKNIKHIIKKIPFDKHLMYWVHDAIAVKNLNIENFYGVIDYTNLKNAYKQMYLTATANSLAYKYNPNLEPVISKKTILEFKHGALFIRPIEAYSYNTFLKESWLKIDFTHKHETLDLYLMLDGMLNDAILSILKAYKINLPFKQTKGKIDTNLHLKIDLQTIDTDVVGDFITDNSSFDFMGLHLQAYDAKVHLNNTLIMTNNMFIKYQNILETNASLIYDAKQNNGFIDFMLSDINTSGVKLSNNSKPLHVVYNIDTNNSILNIDASRWTYLDQNISFAPLSLPFNIHTLLVNIPSTMFTLNDIAKGYIGGIVDINTTKAEFDLDLLEFNYAGIVLNETNMPFKIKYNKVLTIDSLNDIYLSVNGSPYRVKNAKAIINNSSIKLKHTVVEVGDFISTKIYAKYNYNIGNIHLSLNNFVLKNPKTSSVLYNNNKILLQAKIKENHIQIKSNELNAEFYSDDTLWKLNLHSLERIAKDSQLLKNLKLTNGQVSLHKKSDEYETYFDAKVIYPYALIFNNNKPVKQYKASGKIRKDLKIYFDVNKKIKVKISDKVKISTKNIGINLPAIIHLVNDLEAINSKEKQNQDLFLNATNSYIYLSKDRRAISDKIYLQYSKNILTAQLRYKQGDAGFRLEKNNFHLYGKNFNDKYMQNISSLSKFKGGRLDFSINGMLSDYDGVFYIKNTTMIDYKILNNILAFVNTIPSLVTFSLPGYNKNGLKINNGYMKFHYKDSVFNISDLYLASNELTILGKGKADIEHDKIDLTMNLKTDLGSNISKVPLVGYIIFDGKSIATTLGVSGKLTDPKIQTQVAQDIVVAPLNIIKRTLTLPYKLIQKAVNDINTSR